MPVEVKHEKYDEGMVMATYVFTCVRCGESTGNVDEVVAIWLAPEYDHTTDELVYPVDFAHEDCEARYLSALGEPNPTLAKRMHQPLRDFFAMLRGAPS